MTEIPKDLVELAEREGFRWIEAREIVEGDQVRGEGSGGRVEWFVVTIAAHKPKTIWLRLEPTSPELQGSMNSRPRHEDFIPVKPRDEKP